ncbi:MAG: tRNA pseudouridine(38-40) synthase TruA [Bacilli bacterium]|nr:tRNA pseudouridine(38-40) synthase TruA [Bacilli bacterium]
MKYLINLSYNGSKYYGYQIQKNKDTVEGEIEKVLSKIFNTNINTIGASRTDKGVHALNQYCTFEVTKDLNSKKLLHSLNSLLSENVYVKSIRKVNDNFNVRYDVKRKEYIYKINMGEYNPIESEYVYQYCKNIDKELLDIFINQFKGEHNYRSFTSDKDNGSYIRNVIIDYKISKKVLYLRFESSGFLRYMIRNIVGLLLDINDSKKSICDIEDIFSKKDRTSLGRCASPVGLYLSKIEY